MRAIIKIPKEDFPRRKGKSYIYYNLHKKCWSIMQDGKVVGHADEMWLDTSEFRVRQGGRKRVLKEKKKNVHAFVVTNGIVSLASYGPDAVGRNYVFRQVKYNPYKSNSFVYAETGKKADRATMVMMRSDRTVWAVDPIEEVA